MRLIQNDYFIISLWKKSIIKLLEIRILLKRLIVFNIIILMRRKILFFKDIFYSKFLKL